MELLIAGVVVIALIVVLSKAVKIVKQWERGVVLRFGRLKDIRDPGLRIIVPFVDQMIKVDLRIVTMVLEPQEVITRDNVTIKVDAVVYFQVYDAQRAVINVEDYRIATTQIALATLRSVLGQSELDEILAHRDAVNSRMREIIAGQTEQPWGVRVTVAEVKDVLLPEVMQRAMARQAEAEREKRAKIIHAEGELAAAQTLADAGDILGTKPIAVQLRYLQTLTEIAGERSSTIIPLPIDILGAVRDALALAPPARAQGGRQALFPKAGLEAELKT